MANLNGTPVNPRHNRPSVVGNTYLELFYIQNGTSVDPWEVCSVHIFKDSSNGDSSVWLDTSASSPTFGLVPSSNDSEADFIFIPSGGADPGDAGFLPTNFDGTVGTASGIFKIDTGRFAVVLKDGVSGGPYRGAASVFESAASATGKYFDIWTVTDATNSSKPRTLVHSFELFNDSTFSLTEPLLVETSFKLIQKYINKNSKTRIQILCDHIINNRNITEELKNIFRNSVITSAAIRIVKLKDSTSEGLPYTQILDWSDTSGSVHIDSEDTISYLFDATQLDTGNYELQVSSNVLDQTVSSDRFSLVVR